MDLSLLKLQQLMAVARCGSFSAAAKELHISQPALSRSIAALEQRYGFQIFNRFGHGVELTAIGTQVAAQAQSVLQGLQVFDNNLQLFGSGRAGKLSLGMNPLLASEVLARLAGSFFAPGMQAQLRVLIRPGHELLDALRSDEVEICFLPEGHFGEGPVVEWADIAMEQIGMVSPICVVRTGHPLASRPTITLEDISQFPWASSVEPPFGPEVPSASRLICDNYHVLREAVMATDLIGICSTGFVQDEIRNAKIIEITVPELKLRPTGIYMAKLSGRVSSPLALEAVSRLAKYLLP